MDRNIDKDIPIPSKIEENVFEISDEERARCHELILSMIDKSKRREENRKHSGCE